MADKYSVLVVDDESMTFDLVEDSLIESYTVNYAPSGEEGLKAIQADKPDVVLLDVEMPGIGGLDVCRQIKADESLSDIMIIFVSAADELEDRLKGYEAGGDDYIVKPFYGEELQTKLKIAIDKIEQAKALKEDASAAFQTAMTAMTSTGELGRVLQFLRQSFTCQSYDEVATQVIEAMNEYGLKSILQIRGRFGTVYLGDKGAVTSLEETLLTRMEQQERIFDFGCRTAFNYPKISLLIKNMPMDDPDMYGRIKDNVALLVEGADARLASLDESLVLARQREALRKMMERSEDVLMSFKMQYGENKEKNMKVMDGLSASIEKSFMFLGLTEEQEETMMNALQDAVQKSLALYEEGFEIEKELEAFDHDVKLMLSKF